MSDFTGLIGWSEAEEAIRTMLKKSESLGLSFEKLWIRPEDFSGDSLTGFCILLAEGYIRVGYPTGYFWIGEKLIETMRRRPTWSQLPDPPEFLEMYDRVRHEYADAYNRGKD